MRACFLVGRQDETHAASQPGCSVERAHREHHRRNRSLHVARAEPVKLTVLDRGFVRVEPPLIQVSSLGPKLVPVDRRTTTPQSLTTIASARPSPVTSAKYVPWEP